MTNATHSGYTQTTNERLDSLFKTYTEADNMAADRDYADEHYNACSQAAYVNYSRALDEANNAKFSPNLLERFYGSRRTVIIGHVTVSNNDLREGDVFHIDGNVYEVQQGNKKKIDYNHYRFANGPTQPRRDDMITRW